MFVFELTKPGSHLVSDDREWSWNMQGLLSHLESAFFEANVALNLFDYERTRVSEQFNTTHSNWHNDTLRRSELEDLIRRELNLEPYENYEVVRFEAEVRFKREQWAQGLLPRQHSHCLAFIHAKSFLYALDCIDKFLKVISQYPKSPAVISDLYNRMGHEIPELRAVRNSTQHLEDRARGLGAPRRGRAPEPLELKPVENGFINAPTGVLALGNLNGSKFGTTMEDGHYGKVDVSAETLSKVRGIVQDAFDSFDWSGPKVHLPS